MNTLARALAATVLLATATAARCAANDDDLHSSFQTADGKATIFFDFSGAPDLKPWAIANAAPALVQWYPKICALLAQPGFTCSKTVYVQFKEIDAPAYTVADHITANPQWFRDHPNDANALVHEATHVVQAYGASRRPGAPQNPGWLVEGLDDYVRFYIVEPATDGARIGPKRATTVHYNDSYRTTANFLHYLVVQYGAQIIPQLNAAMRAHRYSAQTWIDLTGKPVEALADAWTAALLSAPPPAPSPAT